MTHCPWCWFSHGCDLEFGHEGDHECLDHSDSYPETKPRYHPDVFHFRTDEPEVLEK